MSLVNSDCFCQNQHLLVHEAASPRIVPVVSPISVERGEREEVGVVFVSIWHSQDGYIIGKKSDIAVCATDCFQNCAAPVSLPIHHHLSTIRAVMICRFKMDGCCCPVDGRRSGQYLILPGHLTQTFRSTGTVTGYTMLGHKLYQRKGIN